MLVQCPSCHTTYKVSDDLVSTASPTFRCSRCKHTFILGLKSEAPPVPETTPPPPITKQEDREEHQEMSFSFPPIQSKKEREEIREEESDLQQSEDLPKVAGGGENLDPMDSPSLKMENKEPFPSPEDTADLTKEEGILSPPAVDEEPPTSMGYEEASSHLTEDSYAIPEEDLSHFIDTTTEVEPETKDLENFSPILEERETALSYESFRGQSASTTLYLSLFGVLLIFYSLLTLTHQTKPRFVESFIKAIPFLGSSVFYNNHLRQGIALQSLRTSFHTILGNRKIFLISGVAVNRNPINVREIQLEGQIYNREGKEIGSQRIWLGNAISSKIIRDLTAQEISILQNLSPQTRFEIPSEGSSKFVIVFVKPNGDIKDFTCLVLSAEESKTTSF